MENLNTTNPQPVNQASSAAAQAVPQMKQTSPLDHILQKVDSQYQASVADGVYHAIPTNGLVYTTDYTTLPKIELRVEPLRGIDEKFILTLQTRNRLDRVKLFNERVLGQRATLTIDGNPINMNDLHPADYLFVLFTLKAMTTPSLSIVINDEDVGEHELDVNLRELPITTLPEVMEAKGFSTAEFDKFMTVTLPISKLEIKLKYLTLKETLINEDAFARFVRMIDTVDGERLNGVDKARLLEKLYRDELDAIIEYITEISDFGLPQYIERQLPLPDGSTVQKRINLSIDLFFPF